MVATVPQKVPGTSVQIPLPALPSAEFWTETQWAVLRSLLEAVLPSIARPAAFSEESSQVPVSEADYAAALELIQNTMENPPAEEKFQEYLAHNPAHDPEFVESTTRTLAALPSGAQRQLGGAMGALA